MISNNEMNLNDRDVAKLIAAKVYNPNPKKDEFALQLFIENLVLPENCSSYNEEELAEYIMDFMGRV